ncbi:MAG: chloroplast polyribonucleotide phosphorylase [Monoraphidium minutum]|nr:MAG: chloroplast polyribonucleotide phosphorylase [Monoraphidium minutum]
MRLGLPAAHCKGRPAILMACIRPTSINGVATRCFGSGRVAPGSRGQAAVAPVARLQRGRTVLCSASSESYTLPKADRLEMDVAGQTITLETGEIGRQANGAIMATMGETVIYTTVCCDSKPTGDGSFTPLQVHYQERFSAAGRTSGSFLKREGRPKDDDVLIARLVDRPLRPMFEKGWSNDTQVLQWVLSYDGVNQPEPLAITAAAAALMVSDIPLKKAVAGVRVALLGEGLWVVNPSAVQMGASRLDLMMAGTKDAVLMIEGFCDFLSEEQMIEAIGIGAEAISKMCSQMEAWAAKVGKAKRTDRVLLPKGLEARVAELTRDKVEAAYRAPTSKEVRNGEVEAARRAMAAAVLQEFPGVTDAQIQMAFKGAESAVMRGLVLKEGTRADGRGVADVRPITSRASVLPRTHGSALFTRGETQALCVTTLGTSADAQKVDSIRSATAESVADGASDSDGGGGGGGGGGRNGMALETFYLQYFFPPSSVGETGRVGGVGRRELGHGELAQRALAPVIPSKDEFPYTIRVESTITESNGSSSMASVCGGCLAMLDAGVPLKEPVAGIAMGLILEPDGSFQVLSDILGSEDALGDMDFKVAGGRSGVSAFQMDIKVEGITLDIMRKAMAQAGEGRAHILKEMECCSPPPRRDLSTHAPVITMMRIDRSKIGALIGPGGKNIKAVGEASGATLEVDDNGDVWVSAPSRAAAQAAQDMVLAMTTSVEVGAIFRRAALESRPVVGVMPFGAFVEIAPGRQGLVHVSEYDRTPVADMARVAVVGDTMDVMMMGKTPDGKIKLSRKAVLLQDAGEEVPALTPGGGRDFGVAAGGGGGWEPQAGRGGGGWRGGGGRGGGRGRGRGREAGGGGGGGSASGSASGGGASES